MTEGSVPGPTAGIDADREYSELLDALRDAGIDADVVRRLDEVVGVRLGVAEVAQPEPEFDETGFVVLCLNRRGGLIAFGPYGEMEAHEVASFAEALVPTWFIQLNDDGVPSINRYGMSDNGQLVEKPERTDPHPTRADRATRQSATDRGEPHHAD